MKKFKDILNKNKTLLIAIFVLIVVEVIATLGFSYVQNMQIKYVSYNEFLAYVNEGMVDTVTYSPSDEYMTFTLFNKKTKKMTVKERKEYTGYELSDTRKTFYPAYETFRKDMLKKNVILKLKQSAQFDLATLLSTAFMIVWLFIIVNLLKSVRGGGVEKSDILQQSDIKFSDVIGQDEILEDIQLYVELIKNPDVGKEMGVKTPKGLLLTGPPGTGKTLIAKAIAGEADVPFVSMSGSDFKEMFVGVGAKRVRDLFKIAREHAPCIIFIDEIDSIGAKRDGIKGSSEDDQTINALLKEMDGFSGREGIFVLAATNHPEKLDSALKRAGRFDREVAINPPRDWKVRKQLFEFYLKDKKLLDDVDLETLSKTVSGFTGADISMICNEAGIIAISKKLEYIDNECLVEAVDKKVFNGNKSKKEAFAKDREIVAYHESGHAVMTWLRHQPISRASIQATTSGVGGAVFGAETESQFTTKQDMIDHVMIAQAGRASEEIKYSADLITTGASNDITQVTQTLTNYICRVGFDDEIGLVDVNALAEVGILDKHDLAKRVTEMSKNIYLDTLQLLKDNYDKVEKLAQKLLEVETMSGTDIVDLLEET